MKIQFHHLFLSSLLLVPLATEAEPLQIILSGATEDIRAVSLDSPCNQNPVIGTAEASTDRAHGIKLVDAQTDRLIWQLDTMEFAVCADITAVDSNEDGYIDRLYFANTGGQLWRLELEGDDKDLWRAQLLLELQGGQPFFTAPDVVVSQDGSYYGVIIGSAAVQQNGTQPIQNYLIFYRDHCVQIAATNCTADTKTLSDLQQLIHPNRAQQPLDKHRYNNGWYLPLAPDEITVTRAVTNNYTTLVATFNSAKQSPYTDSTCQHSDCSAAGESRLYYFNPFYFDSDPELEDKPYYRLVEAADRHGGAEPLPEPEPFIQLPEPASCQGQGCSSQGPIIAGFNFGDIQQQIELPELGLIVKTWWYSPRDD